MTFKMVIECDAITNGVKCTNTRPFPNLAATFSKKPTRYNPGHLWTTRPHPNPNQTSKAPRHLDYCPEHSHPDNRPARGHHNTTILHDETNPSTEDTTNA